DRGLAGADVGLEEALHRALACQILDDRGNGAVLIAGQLEREQSANVRVDGRVREVLWPRLPTAYAAAAHGQGDLQDQKFFVDEPPPRLHALRQHLGKVDLPQRLRDWWIRALD